MRGSEHSEKRAPQWAARGWRTLWFATAAWLTLEAAPAHAFHLGPSDKAPGAASSDQIEASAAEPATAATARAASSAPTTSAFSLENDPDRPRSVFWMPLASFVLPGLDQWWEGQHGYGAFYSGTALVGTSFATRAARRYDLVEKADQKKKENDLRRARGEELDKEDDALDPKTPGLREQQLGLQLYQWAGGMSAWHSFRSAVRSHQATGRYEFLHREESPQDVMLAPFDVRYLKNARTYIPLSIGVVLAALQVSVNSGSDSDFKRERLTSADAAFSGAISYNAGTHEEAMFRGWLMPVMYENWRSPFWTNMAQSLLFAAAHLNTHAAPIPQFLLGYHFGSITMEDDWRIGESVFIHVWWDVIAFASNYQWAKKTKDPELRARRLAMLPPLTLPPLTWHF